MKKKYLYAIVLLCVLVFVSCATMSWYAGTLGSVYFTTDDYSEEYAAVKYNNNYSDLKQALWMYKTGITHPSFTGCKVLFYSDLDDNGFFNEYVPAIYRAESIEDAGFLLIAEEASPVYYSTYNYSSGTKCSVNYGTACLKLYSIASGECLYTGTVTKGPTPPQTMSVYAGTTSVTWDTPEPSSFESQIASICKKIAHGKIAGSVPDQAKIESVTGQTVKTSSNPLSGLFVSSSGKNTTLTGIWEGSADDCSYKLIFTDDGHYIYEESSDDYLYDLQLLEYEYVDEVLTIDGEETAFMITGKTMTIEGVPSDVVLKQKSKKAQNQASASKLLGVWKGQSVDEVYSAVAFTSDGFVIFQGSESGMGSYKADGENVYIDYDEDPYVIVDDCLYIYDESFFGTWYDPIKLERRTGNGKDGTSKSVLTSAESWTYSDSDDSSGDIYSFSSNGKYTDIYFWNYGVSRDDLVSGTYTFSDHVIYLSSGTELSFAYIDGIAIGFTL